MKTRKVSLAKRSMRRASSIRGQSAEDVKQLESFAPVENVEIDKLLIEERDEEIAQLAKNAEALNRIVADVNAEVLKQDVDLDVIAVNQGTTLTNMKEANKELNEANTLSK